MQKHSKYVVALFISENVDFRTRNIFRAFREVLKESNYQVHITTLSMYTLNDSYKIHGENLTKLNR